MKSSDQLLSTLQELGLLSAEVIGEIKRRWQQSGVRPDAISAAKELVKTGRLTRYQAEEILNGRGARLSFGAYVILDKLGEGGMGMVLRGQHREMKRPVAIKMLPKEMLKNLEASQRFKREAEAAGRLLHPNIVTAYDSGTLDGTPYLVMELVAGSDLHSFVSDHGPMRVLDAIHCITEVARGLEYAHEQGIVHRDIKPANLLLATGSASGTTKSGTAAVAALAETAKAPDVLKCRVKILDMGLARIDEAALVQVAGAAEKPGTSPLTQAGDVMGTVDYMSPEQAMDTRSVDGRADIYALGCTLHYLLTGKPPFSGENMMQRLMAHKVSPIPSLQRRRPDVPDRLDQLFHSMLAKDVDDRIATMAEVIAELEECRLEVRSDSQRSASGRKSTPKKIADPRPPSEARQTMSLARDETLEIEERPQPANGGMIIKGIVGTVFLVLAILLTVVVTNRLNQPNRAVTTNPPPEIATPASSNPDATKVTPDILRITPPRPWSDRDAAEWALNNGGTVRILMTSATGEGLSGVSEAQVMELQKSDSLPQGEFQISALNLERVKGDIDGNVARLTGLSKLTELDLSGTELTAVGAESLSQSQSLTSLDVRGCQLESAGLKSIGQLRGLITLSIGDPPPSETSTPAITVGSLKDADLVELYSLTELQRLTLSGTSLTEASVVKMIERYPKLVSLELHSVRLTDSSLLAFSKLSFLRSLSLIKADLSDDAVDGLSMFETLTQLNIQGNNISNDGIKRLQRSLGRCVIYGGDYDSMRNLVREIVQVNGTVTVSPEGEESRVIDQRTFNDLPSEFFIRKVDLSSVRPLSPHLLDVKDVTELDLSDSAVSIQSLRQLPSLAPAVTILNLSGTAVTDAEISVFASMNSLQELDVSRTKVTLDRVAAFKQQRPDCHIIGP